MTRGVTVSDCKITHVGQRYFSACGVLLMHASECDILHNEIGDLYYTGVSVGWTWGYWGSYAQRNEISFNLIKNIFFRLMPLLWSKSPTPCDQVKKSCTDIYPRE